MFVSAIAGPVAGAVVGGLLGGGSSGGGTQTQNSVRTPWEPAQPWLQDQISRGQSLQNYYGATPFSGAQQQAMGHMGDQSAYIRNLIPSLLQQMSGGQFFNRGNMGARPTPFSFMGAQQGAGAGMQGGLGAITPPVAQAAGGMLGQLQAGGQGINPALSAPPVSVTNPTPIPFAATNPKNGSLGDMFDYFGFGTSSGA